MNGIFDSLLFNLLEFRSKREWEKFHLPKELAAAISIESSELQELFLWRERESPEEIKQDHNRMNLIVDEIADILIYLIFLSHDLGIDLFEATNKKLEKNIRKYPEGIYKGRFEES